MVEEPGIAEIEAVEGGEKAHITCVTAAQPVFAASAAIIPAAAAPVAAVPTPTVSATLVVRDLFNAQKSSMVGIFCRAPGPNAPVFVGIGQQVKVGDTLCIIEAMKLMNEIETEKSGVTKEILVDNGTPVEYGEPPFIIG